MSGERLVWVAYTTDMGLSQVAVFDEYDEVGALRWALENHGEVIQAQRGVELWQQIQQVYKGEHISQQRPEES